MCAAYTYTYKTFFLFNYIERPFCLLFFFSHHTNSLSQSSVALQLRRIFSKFKRKIRKLCCCIHSPYIRSIADRSFILNNGPSASQCERRTDFSCLHILSSVLVLRLFVFSVVVAIFFLLEVPLVYLLSLFLSHISSSASSSLHFSL